MTTKLSFRRSKWGHGLAAVACAGALLSTILFGLRTYGSFLLLRSAYEAGAPMTSSVRAWMTLDYVATTYRTPRAALLERLGLPANTDPNASLKSLADRAGISRPVYAQQVQRAIADLAPGIRSGHTDGSSSWLGVLADGALTALLVYGYPALGLTLLFGAIGFPLPDGVATTIAGSLASQGRMNWFWAATVVVAASVLGDAIGYGLGRVLGRELLERHGHWFGYTTARHARVRLLFERWGLATIFLTRTVLSYLSSVASLLAGMSHYDLFKFLATTLVGRLVWTAAYLGLGYGIGSDWQAATSFLTNLSILILSLMLLIVAAIIASGRFAGSAES